MKKLKGSIVGVIVAFVLFGIFIIIKPPASCVFIECLLVEVFAAIFIGWLVARKINRKNGVKLD